MSYDTTVHDTLDPPAPRGVAARVAGSGGHGRGLRTRRFWKPAVIAAAALSVLLLVTWLVAALSPRPVNQPADESRPASHSSLMPGGNAKLPLSVIENQFGVCEPSRGAKWAILRGIEGTRSAPTTVVVFTLSSSAARRAGRRAGGGF